MKIIEKIWLRNFKKFEDEEILFSDDLNILVGDNESGKSSILKAIEIVVSGSQAKIANIGLESLFNKNAISKFMAGNKIISLMPKIEIDLYIKDCSDFPELYGRFNQGNKNACGLHLVCEPDVDHSKDIDSILKKGGSNFPFEFYKVGFFTFSGESYSSYRKYFNYLFIDGTEINNEYATKSYIKTIFESNSESAQRARLENEYRKNKEEFKENFLSEVNKKIENFEFSVGSGLKSNLQADLTIIEDGIALENKGKGRQCLIKTEFALQRVKQGKPLDTLLLEEPENHLSHGNMKKLVEKIRNSSAGQIFISTHSSFIASKLDLRKSILLSASSGKALLFNGIPSDTADFFIKSPVNNVLEFCLSKKVILVEGNAEYILSDVMYEKVNGTSMEEDGVHLISVGGTSFKRYLDIALRLGIRVAVIRDNDKNFKINCVDGFSDYANEKDINVFYDSDNSRSTLEIAVYEDNRERCDEIFGEGRRSLSVKDYMLSNKTEAAYKMLKEIGSSIKVPNYIERAVKWIKE
ncbi:ATP-dependent endonuclease [Alcanivorax sp. 24]|uniref:ATP-dependent nuclease n=1 Tax=Alcanivorax sp. 24 TaxID=2545266 RepID=UPI00105C93DC|nr:AAA family ATPase [Alcanivorax sp. 24]